MKTLFILIAVLTSFSLPARTQILGIFEQGAEELSEYGQQIAALELLLTRQQKGYQLIESGLTTIANITDTEFNLHQNYYSSLGTVNPAITQSPELDQFRELQSQLSSNLTTALDRWQESKYLTAGDRLYIAHTSANIANMSTSQSITFKILTSDEGVTLSDDQRAEMISRLHSQALTLYVFARSFIDAVDLLILNRED